MAAPCSCTVQFFQYPPPPFVYIWPPQIISIWHDSLIFPSRTALFSFLDYGTFGNGLRPAMRSSHYHLPGIVTLDYHWNIRSIEFLNIKSHCLGRIIYIPPGILPKLSFWLNFWIYYTRFCMWPIVHFFEPL